MDIEGGKVFLDQKIMIKNYKTNMKKTTFILVLSLTLIGCSQKKNNIEVFEFLNYIKDDFQEEWKSNYSVYAWSCYIKKDTVLFSGSIYLMPDTSNVKDWLNQESKEKIINTINKNLNKSLHESYNLWAQIAYKDEFLTLNEHIDNPCEYYKENNPDYYIYNSKKGTSNWVLIEKTKNRERIEEIILEKTKKITTYIEENNKLKYPKLIEHWQGTYSFEYGRTQMREIIGAVTSFTILPEGIVKSKTTGDVLEQCIDDQGNMTGEERFLRKIDRDEIYEVVDVRQDSLKIRHTENLDEEHLLFKDKAGNYFIEGSAYFVPAPDFYYPLTKEK